MADVANVVLGEPVDAEDAVKRVLVRPRLWINKGQIVVVLNSGKKIKAKSNGTVMDVKVAVGDQLDAEIEIYSLTSECFHSTRMKDMCADCGQDLKRDDETKASASSSSSVAMVHSIPELKVSSDEALRLGREDERRLRKHKKLVLLVDLDQTLIHTTNENVPANVKGVSHFQLYGANSAWYHTRVRPYTQEFLEAVSKLYELHIVTFGARLYAHTVAGLIDADGAFFSHRILSRDECFDARTKTANLSSLFPCGDHMVAIIDDREDVWKFATNLVHVKPYNFFKNTGDINAPPGSKQRKEDDVDDKGEKKSDTESEGEEDKKSKNDDDFEDDLIEMEDNDDYLKYLQDILTTIHTAYYDLNEQSEEGNKPDLKAVIPYVKRKTLQGAQLVFSGVVPNHVPLKKSRAFHVARSLGAGVSEKVEEGVTTHLVAALVGTAKLNEAKRINKTSDQKIHVVTPNWLWSCAERWERIDERLFPLSSKTTVTLKPPAHCSSPEIAFAERCADICAELENRKKPLAETTNPMLTFSSDELKGMGDEVDDELSDSSSESDDGNAGSVLVTKDQVREQESSSSEQESLDAGEPKGWAKNRKRMRLENVDDDTDDDEEDEDGIDDLAHMAQELERQMEDKEGTL